MFEQRVVATEYIIGGLYQRPSSKRKLLSPVTKKFFHPGATSQATTPPPEGLASWVAREVGLLQFQITGSFQRYPEFEHTA